jgi:hypothetical protein
MSKRNTLIDRVVNRAVEDAETKKEIEDLRQQRREILANLAGGLRQISGESNEEPEDAADDDGDVRLDWDDDEEEEWDDD